MSTSGTKLVVQRLSVITATELPININQYGE